MNMNENEAGFAAGAADGPEESIYAPVIANLSIDEERGNAAPSRAGFGEEDAAAETGGEADEIDEEEDEDDDEEDEDDDDDEEDEGDVEVPGGVARATTDASSADESDEEDDEDADEEDDDEEDDDDEDDDTDAKEGA